MRNELKIKTFSSVGNWIFMADDNFILIRFRNVCIVIHQKRLTSKHNTVYNEIYLNNYNFHLRFLDDLL